MTSIGGLPANRREGRQGTPPGGDALPSLRIFQRFDPPPRRPAAGGTLHRSSLAGFARRTIGWHQFGSAGLAIVIATLHFVPVDLQRRIIDGAIVQDQGSLLLGLGAIYLAVLLFEAAFKYVLLVYQGWLSESAIKTAREEVAGIAADNASGTAQSGQVVAVIGSEIEHVGGFVGERIPQAVMNAALFAAMAGYMLAIAPWLALCSLMLLAPQCILAPCLQSKLNCLVRQQLGLARRLGDEVAGTNGRNGLGLIDRFGTISSLYRNRVQLYALKFALKALLNLAHAVGPVVVLVAGGWAVIRGQTTLGTVLAFAAGFERLAGPARELLAFYRVAAQAKVQHTMIVAWVGRQGHDIGTGNRHSTGNNPDSPPVP